jgi:phage terminase large subunit GpA-like protein
LEALDDPLCESVVIAKGSQTALTTTAYAWLAKCCATDPGSALIVMNSTQDARDKSAETWRPMWEDSPMLRRYLPDNRKMHWTKRMQIVNKAGVYWAGANSPGALASKSMRRIFGDELDKWPQSFGRGNKHSGAASASEAGALELVLQRCKAYRQKGLAKILVTSTPTDDQGPIWRVYQAGDKRHLNVKCYKCGVEQVMLWASL